MKANGKYRIIHICYWMMMNVVFGYSTFFLAGYGYSAGEVGILNAIFGAISAVLQPMLGRVADKSRRFNWKILMLLLTAASVVTMACMAVFKAKLLGGLMFGLLILFLNAMMPMVNAACFYYQKRGVHVDFGIARGMGSMFYAMISVLLGRLTVSVGRSAIPASGIPILMVLFLAAFFMPILKEEQDPDDESPESLQNDGMQKKEAGTAKTGAPDRVKKNFLQKYPAFSVMLLAGVLLMASHTYITTFLLQIIENVGGDTTHLGVALAIGAVMEVPLFLMYTRIVKRWPAAKLLVVSGFSYIAKGALLLLAGSVEMVYAAHLLQPISYALYASSSVYFTDECMQEEDKVTGQSLMTMTSAVGSVFGNLTGGWLLDTRGVDTMLVFNIGVAVLLAAVTTISAAMHIRAIRNRHH